MKIPHLETEAVPIVELEGDQLLGVGIEVVSVVAWAVDNGKHDRFVRIDARNRDGDIVLGSPLLPSSARRLRTSFEPPPGRQVRELCPRIRGRSSLARLGLQRHACG